MAAFSGIPTWIQKSKSAIKHSNEWQSFTQSLYDEVQKLMLDTGVAVFSELTATERTVMMTRALHAIKSGEEYVNLLERASESLDVSLSNEVTKNIYKKDQTLTKNQLLENECENAVASLVNKWPAMQSSFLQCFNAKLPPLIRYTIWKNSLKNLKAHAEYLKLVNENSKKLVSSMDLEISQKCQILLESDPTLKEITNKKAFFPLMRHILSYKHAQGHGNCTVMDSDYMLLIPLVETTLQLKNSNHDHKNLSTKELAILVEEYTCLMENRPDYMKFLGPSFADFIGQVQSIVYECEKDLATALEKMKISPDSRDDYIEFVPKSKVVIARILHPMIRSLFIGFLPLSTVLHAWDMIIIGYTNTKYDPLPYICACILLLLREDLLACQTDGEAETAILYGCRGFQVDYLQHAFTERGFQDYLMQKLIKEEDMNNFPVFHPLPQSNLPSWCNWYSDKLVAYFEGQQATPDVLFFKDTDKISSAASFKRKASFPHEEFWQLEQTKANLEEEAAKLRQERNMLIDELEAEHKLMVNIQQVADEEIDLLRRQVNALRENKQSVSDISLASPVYASSSKITEPSTILPSARPSSNKSHVSSLVNEETEVKKPLTPNVGTPSVIETPVAVVDNEKEEKSKKVTIDVLARMMGAIHKIANGGDKAEKQLNDMTKKDSEKFNIAFEKAKKTVYGPNVTDKDIAKLSMEEKQKKAELMDKYIKKTLFGI